VLSGATNTLWSLRPFVFVCVDSETQWNSIVEHVRDHAYQSWILDLPMFNPANYNQRSEDIFPGKRLTGIFCIPEEIEVDVELEGCTIIR
jgi:hypothetical protein